MTRGHCCLYLVDYNTIQYQKYTQNLHFDQVQHLDLRYIIIIILLLLDYYYTLASIDHTSYSLDSPMHQPASQQIPPSLSHGQASN